MKKKSPILLGYTRTGRAVRLPTPGQAEKFAGWTRGDHVDASRILRENGERAGDATLRSWYAQWAGGHRDLAREAQPSKPMVRGAAETAIRTRRRR